MAGSVFLPVGETPQSSECDSESFGFSAFSGLSSITLVAFELDGAGLVNCGRSDRRTSWRTENRPFPVVPHTGCFSSSLGSFCGRETFGFIEKAISFLPRAVTIVCFFGSPPVIGASALGTIPRQCDPRPAPPPPSQLGSCAVSYTRPLRPPPPKPPPPPPTPYCFCSIPPCRRDNGI